MSPKSKTTPKKSVPKKAPAKIKKAKETLVTEVKTAPRYIEAVGRRKTSVARVRMFEGSGVFVVNNKPLEHYFNNVFWQKAILEPLRLSNLLGKFDFTVKVKSGGVNSQVEAIRHGIARVLVAKDEKLRSVLKAKGFLKRDPRMKERRKFGLKKARRAPQWSKR